ncbi:MAG TPA: hypothetical protein PLS63_09655 [Microthrixaceae bacterium]|nr:hypothetical protein [Microthrixaceae bacterium]
MAKLRWNDTVWTRTQAVALWAVGIGALVNELFIQPQPRPMAFPLIAGILGFPLAQAADKRRSGSSDRTSGP